MEFRDFLTKSFIKSYAQNDEVYADGFSYYRNGRVTHAVASKDKRIYQFTVKGNYNYKVTIRLTDGNLIGSRNWAPGSGCMRWHFYG